MIFRKELSPDGAYQDPSGQRYTLSYCRYVRSMDGINIGWYTFPDLASCLKEWGLSPAGGDEPQRTETRESR